jgi:hypothetical protein
MRNSTSLRACVAVVASAAFLWALTLSASPQLHERVHKDANRVEHTCAVTFVASGSVDCSPIVLLIGAPVPLNDFKVPELSPRWVWPIFLVAAVFEHAPPA